MSGSLFKQIDLTETKHDRSSHQLSDPDLQIGRLLCSICLFIVYPPVQLVCCGLRICESCSRRFNETFKCPACSEPDYRVMLDRGHKRTLESEPITCSRCDQFKAGNFKDFMIHINFHKDLKCSDCNEEFVFPQQLEKHQRYDCENRTVSCPLAFLGCFQKVLHNKLMEHYLTSEHQHCLMKFVKQIFPQISQGNLKLTFQKSVVEQFQRNLIQILERIKLLLRDVTPMTDNCARLAAERQAMETKINETRIQSTKIREISNTSAKLLESLHLMLASMQKIVDEIKSKSGTGLKLISSNGTFIDKVNLSVLIDNGQTVKSETIHSSLSGYAMQLIYEVHMDGQKQKRYLSISFVILTGNFDPILSWPMEYPITLSIIDLSPTKDHITHSIPLEKRTTICNRPVDNANPPHRIQQFCLVDTLLKKKDNYLHDGFFFTQLHIDFTPSSKDLLPNKELPKQKENSIFTDIVEDRSQT